MIFKIISIFGSVFVVIGGILLWRNSPSGYGFSFYGNKELIDSVGKANALMQRKQKIAIGLIILGSVMQAFATFYA